MSRPLLITDCDEVLLHMVAHFAAWLDEKHGVDFAMHAQDFSGALTHQADGVTLSPPEVWPLLDGFFATEMHRQTPVPHAREALARIAEVADIVVLTNLKDHCHAGRVAQLGAVDISHVVMCNQGPKGAPVRELIARYQPPVTVFVDDLPQHHDSVAKTAPEVWRLHMIAEPMVAKAVPPARHAHARIDDWAEALPWILARFDDGRPAGA